jgi:hypothetical protein
MYRASAAGLVALGIASLLSVPALAGDDNTLYLVQNGVGNTFQSDQHLGSYTAIGGLNEEALQAGTNNSATLTLSEAGGLVQSFLQDNSDGTLSSQGITLVGAAYGNTATATIIGAGIAVVSQIGDHNTALMWLEDGNGTIQQTGVENTARLKILSDGVTGKIVQNGNNNTGDMAISGSGSVTLTQIGHDLSYTGPNPRVSYASGSAPTTDATTLQVTTDTSVQITQYN